jgi:CheY-like chemotaxis protein
MTNEILRILIVDDHRDTADALAWVLQSLGHEVYTAYEGATALQMIDQHRPELILQDLQMPSMNGYDIARAVRARPAGRGAVVVAVSGHHAAEPGAANAAQFDLFLPKPVGLQALREVLRTASRHTVS